MKQPNNLPVIFCAIDTPDLNRAIELSKSISSAGCGIKLGLEFFNAFGKSGIQEIMDACPDIPVFIDLKYHDIPNTVAGAVHAISSLKPAYLNVHASGGLDMMRAAKEACAPETKLLAVTLLTSLDEHAIEEVGYKPDINKRVIQMAELAQRGGLDGVVCSSHEIEAIRNVCGDDFALMVPGIRPAGAASGDQKRIMTPQEALNKGATHLVIGRPITGADDPAQAAQNILSTL
ncbi:MAG: orotidine-5'-phosphate decarboxylase [Alphaproteobacteria bacterium]|nr:orotidine-5'-phosphate decarboxylase [Alphaproteobacteria bacterium]